MNTVLSRLNALSAFTISVVGIISFACYLTTCRNSYVTDVGLKTIRTAVRRVPNFDTDGTECDLGLLSFDLATDLAPLRNWNAKQFMLTVAAEYKTNKYSFNQIVLWDKIIQRQSSHNKLDLNSVSPEYYFWDEGFGLRGHPNITLTVQWDVQPNVGPLTFARSHNTHSFAFPAAYARS